MHTLLQGLASTCFQYYLTARIATAGSTPPVALYIMSSREGLGAKLHRVGWPCAESFLDVGCWNSKLRRNLNKLSIKHQSYPKSRKLDAFEEKICNVTINPCVLQTNLCARSLSCWTVDAFSRINGLWTFNKN